MPIDLSDPDRFNFEPPPPPAPGQPSTPDAYTLHLVEKIERLQVQVDNLRALSGEGSAMRSAASVWPAVCDALVKAYGGWRWIRVGNTGGESAAIAIARLARRADPAEADADELAGLPLLETNT